MAEVKKGRVKSVGIYASATMIRQMVSFIMLPIYTAYLSPSDYGIVALMATMHGVFELFIGARFGQALPKFYFEQEKGGKQNLVISTALITTCAISFFSTLLIISMSGPIAENAFDNKDLAPLVAIYAILLFSSAIEAYGMNLLRILDKPMWFLTASISKLVVQLSLNIWFIVYQGMTVDGVVYSTILASSIFAVGYLIFCVKTCGFGFQKWLVKRFFVFMWPLWLAGIAAIYISAISRFLLKYFSSLEEVGLFQLANNFALIVSLLIWMPFSKWWQAERFRIYNNSPAPEAEFIKVFQVVSSLVLIGATGVSLFSESVIRFMADEAFHASHELIIPLTFSVTFTCLSLYFNFSFLALSKTIIVTQIKYVTAVLITIFLFVLVPKWGAIGAAYALMLSNLILLLYSMVRSVKLIKVADNLPVFVILCLVCFVFSWKAQALTYDENLWWQLAKKIIAFVIFLFAYGIVYLSNPNNPRPFKKSN